MKEQDKKIKIERLVDHLLSRGYMTLSRKYSKYLPAPLPIKGYDVDVVAKYDEPKYFSKPERKIAIGIILTEEELNSKNLLSKLVELSKTRTKSGRKVTLFVGVPAKQILKADMLIETLDEETKNKIKLIPLQDEN